MQNVLLSKMKPLAARWLVGAFDYLQENEQFAVNGFKEAGTLMFLVDRFMVGCIAQIYFRMLNIYKSHK